MIFDWFELYSYVDFMSSGLFSKNLNIFFSGYGSKQIMITRGSLVSVIIDDLMIPTDFSDKNPYIVGDYAVYRSENNVIYLGFKVDE